MRSFESTPIAASSATYWGPMLAGPPLHTASTVRPPDMRSRLAHWSASRSGCRRGKLARQIVPSFTRRVRAATADSVTTASRRGLEVRLSPTQTDPK